MNLQETKRFVTFAKLNIKITILNNYETNKNTHLDAVNHCSKRDVRIM